jgi:hypothetical protein
MPGLNRPEDTMTMAKTSVSALIALSIVACVGASASACEWYQKQVLAKAETPPAEEQAVMSATPVDPTLLAEIQSKDGETAVAK